MGRAGAALEFGIANRRTDCVCIGIAVANNQEFAVAHHRQGNLRMTHGMSNLPRLRRFTNSIPRDSQEGGNLEQATEIRLVWDFAAATFSATRADHEFRAVLVVQRFS